MFPYKIVPQLGEEFCPQLGGEIILTKPAKNYLTGILDRRFKWSLSFSEKYNHINSSKLKTKGWASIATSFVEQILFEHAQYVNSFLENVLSAYLKNDDSTILHIKNRGLNDSCNFPCR